MKDIQLWFRSVMDRLLGRKAKGKKAPAGPRSKPVLRSKHSASSEVAPGPPAVPNLDGKRWLTESLNADEAALVERIGESIASGKFELPHLPATTLALVNLAGKPGVDVTRVVELISSDPSLAGELLRVSNSVLYSTHVPASTLNEAVMRIGLRGLRTLIFSVSVKGTVMKMKDLSQYSKEVWRQAFSVATIARKIAPLLEIERERAFLIGLLHDVGKIALLAMLSKEMRRGTIVSPATVGRVFYTHHELAGSRLAEKWRLDAELVSIAGQHHNCKANQEYERGAALASLAHKLDLHMGFDDEASYRGLVRCPEFESLGISEGRRMAVLDQARRAYEEQESEAHAMAA